MTVPLTPGSVTPSAPLAAIPPAPPPPPAVDFPLSWLLDHAAPPVAYRSLVEVARLPLRESTDLSVLPYAYRPALLLAMLQAPDGLWNGSMLTVPSARAEHFQGVGTIPAVRRLVEYGWERESPPLTQARRTLFRLLADREVNVDMIVQNTSDHGVTDISFTVPHEDLDAAREVTEALSSEIGDLQIQDATLVPQSLDRGPRADDVPLAIRLSLKKAGAVGSASVEERAQFMDALVERITLANQASNRLFLGRRGNLGFGEP